MTCYKCTKWRQELKGVVGYRELNVAEYFHR